MKILIVEDLLIMRRVIANSLRTIGYEDIIEAASGEEAFTILADEPVDMIITDWLMPGMSGMDLVKKIKSNIELEDIPIIMLTTKNDKDDVMTAMSAHIDGYIVKPFNAQILKDKIDSIISPYKTYNL